jgi:homoserine dehydrogenase
MENRFFVRVKNETGIDQIEKIFGNVEIIDELEGEYGFVTALMKESEMEEKLADLNGVITRIRWN